MSKKILAVDDHEVVLRTVRFALKRKPQWELMTAKTQMDACEKIVSDHPDLVLLDVNIGEGSGLEILEWMKMSGNGISEIPVIMVTAMGKEVDMEMAQKLGCDGYITKPFKIHELFHAIEGVFTSLS